MLKSAWAERMEVLDYKIIRSLKKSRIRKDVLLFLLKIYPEGSYIAEIAAKIGADPSNVIGALRGNRRYKDSLSLASLGLVEGEEVKETRFYRLSDKGMEMARSLNGS
jgi:hypothetical protein